MDKLWIGFGRNIDFQLLSVQDISNALGPCVAAFPFFPAFGECDILSAFRGKEKKSAWQTWELFLDVRDVFCPLE